MNRTSSNISPSIFPSIALLPAVALCGVLFAGCERESASVTKPALGFAFEEKSRPLGIDFVHTDGNTGAYLLAESLASGVGLFDYDDDGDLDVYFLNGTPMPPPGGVFPPKKGRPGANRFYRQNGDGTFTDVTDVAGLAGVGLCIGCCVGDYDGDGDLDLYVTAYHSNALYRNNGDGTFSDVTAEAGVDDPRFSAGCVFVDIDGDEDLDLYVANYCQVGLTDTEPCTNTGIPHYCAPSLFAPISDSLFRNRGDGTFENFSEESGIAAVAKWGMGVLATDYNGDGRVDLFVANDVSDNFLFENLGGGRFENVGMIRGVGVSGNGDEQGSMGVSAGDYDRDGDFDLNVTNYQEQLNCLYKREEQFGYLDFAMSHGLGERSLPLVGWGTGLFDFDGDGWVDLFIANGHLEDRIEEFDESSFYLQPNQLYKNAKGRFEDVSQRAGKALEERKSSRGAAFGDIDNDGDIDIVISNSRQGPSVLVNQGGNRNSWVQFDLRGKKNTRAIGARVTVEAGGAKQVGEVRSGGSYVSQNDLRLHFGLGDAEKVDRVTIRWPSGKTKIVEQLEARKIHRIQEE